LNPRHKRPLANVSVSQGGLHYPYETGASFSVDDISELNGSVLNERDRVNTILSDI
jgi:hypothetical protein